MKVWMLADNGHNAKTYVGKEGDGVQRNLAMKVVLELTQPLHPGVNITMDKILHQR